MSSETNLKVLIVASECAPFAKTGGLGDVVGSLPGALLKLGVDARVIMPKYAAIKEEFSKDFSYIDSVNITLGWRNQGASVYKSNTRSPVYLIGNDYYFSRGGMYGYGDDFERFAFFTKACLEAINVINFVPDIIHFNDWQTGLGPVYLRDNYAGFTAFSNIKSLITIHNLQYQGIFSRPILTNIGLNDGYFTTDKLEFNSTVNLLKGGLVYADAINTVSNTYSYEIQTPEYGYGLDGVLRAQSYKLSGIINGIDNDEVDPQTSKYLDFKFSSKALSGKKKNKQALQEKLGLPVRADVPMIGIISRLVEQKGFDLVSVAMNEILSKDVQLVILGTGDSRFEGMFKHMAWVSPDKVSANIYFDEDLAQKIYASSDMFLMPSLFEPCGLSQIFAMRYGAVPIVRQTGGLADTVTHYDANTKQGNGFVFKNFDAYGMMWAVNEALYAYSKGSKEWNVIVKNAMKADFSWSRSAEQYVELYNRLKER